MHPSSLETFRSNTNWHRSIRIVILLMFFLLGVGIAECFHNIGVPIGAIKKEAILAKITEVEYDEDKTVKITATIGVGEIVSLTSKWERDQLESFSPIDSVRVGNTYMLYVEFDGVLLPNSLERSETILPTISGPSITTPEFPPIKQFKVYNIVDGMIIPLSESQFYMDESYDKVLPSFAR